VVRKERKPLRSPSASVLTISAIVPCFTRPSVCERLRGAISVLAGTAYEVLVHNVERLERRAATFHRAALEPRAQGLLVVSIPPADEDVPSLLGARLPVVLIDADHPRLETLPRVMVDDVAGGRAATRHLLGLGHARIGFVGEASQAPPQFTSSRDRFWGYREALEAAGLPLRPELCAEGGPTRADARGSAHRLLTLTERPTAVLAASDLLAVGVLEAARELGLRVPQDLSVVGYDDIELAEVVGLTTMRQPLFESGRRGMELLLGALRGEPAEPRREVLPVELVVRGTTAPPRG
jgi:DNA-binding LacI/PurR family transcriptional regulator